jgi:hypothetical protein
MSLGFSRSGACILLSLIAVGGWARQEAQAQGTHRPRRAIELSETNSAEVLTNLNQIAAPKEGRKQLEDQLKSLKGISGDSLEERFNMPYMAPSKSGLPNKTLKELIEKQNSWNITPEDLGMSMNPASTDKDTFSTYGDEKKDGKKNSSLQQFYDALNRQSATRQQQQDRLNNNKDSNSRPPEFRDETVPDDDSKLPDGVRDKVQKLKEMVHDDNNGIFNPTRSKSTFDNFFGLNETGPTKDTLETKSSMESFISQFKKALDGPSPGSGLDPSLKALVGDPSGLKGNTMPSFGAMPKVQPSGREFTESAGSLNPMLNRSVMPDLNGAVLNQWNPMYTPQKTEAPKFTPPTPANMEFPRRRF